MVACLDKQPAGAGTLPASGQLLLVVLRHVLAFDGFSPNRSSLVQGLFQQHRSGLVYSAASAVQAQVAAPVDENCQVACGSVLAVTCTCM